MRTSNKILLALLVVIFTIPLLLAFSLQRKVKKGEYSVVRYGSGATKSNVRSGSFSTYKVVKVVAPAPESLTCHLKQSDSLNYTYYHYNDNDSLTVFTSDDTLFVKYTALKEVTGDNERKGYDNLEININLHSINNIVADGANVIIDSLAASPGKIVVTLKNKGEIRDGSENSKRRRVKE